MGPDMRRALLEEKVLQRGGHGVGVALVVVAVDPGWTRGGDVGGGAMTRLRVFDQADVQAVSQE